MNESIFPSIKKSIETLIEDEEGNIPAGKLLTIGTLIVLLGSVLSMEAFAAHGSHKSHSSHSSHSSTSYIRDHSNHGSHSNHASHASHSSHTSHSNTASHSNSNYSAAGDYGTPLAPAASSITAPQNPVSDTVSMLNLPTVNTNIAVPEATPAAGAVPVLAVPLDTPQTDLAVPEVQQASATPRVKE